MLAHPCRSSSSRFAATHLFVRYDQWNRTNHIHGYYSFLSSLAPYRAANTNILPKSFRLTSILFDRPRFPRASWPWSVRSFVSQGRIDDDDVVKVCTNRSWFLISKNMEMGCFLIRRDLGGFFDPRGLIAYRVHMGMFLCINVFVHIYSCIRTTWHLNVPVFIELPRKHSLASSAFFRFQPSKLERVKRRPGLLFPLFALDGRVRVRMPLRESSVTEAQGFEGVPQACGPTGSWKLLEAPLASKIEAHWRNFIHSFIHFKAKYTYVRTTYILLNSSRATTCSGWPIVASHRHWSGYTLQHVFRRNPLSS